MEVAAGTHCFRSLGSFARRAVLVRCVAQSRRWEQLNCAPMSGCLGKRNSSKRTAIIQPRTCCFSGTFAASIYVFAFRGSDLVLILLRAFDLDINLGFSFFDSCLCSSHF
ncbi:hypothetical protein SUGI_0882640 [Cryptomeria japonica]|nr:hypothetical protein SUGI_0882640 [Cryptomeria japonica]